MTSPPDQPFTYVDSSSALQKLRPRLSGHAWLAMDVEADSLHRYSEKICLIQLAIEGDVFIVDTLADIELSGLLADLLHHPLILHSAENDLRLLRRTYDFVPRGELFDTMIAAQLLGHDRLGMASLVDQFFGVAVSKSGQKSDWSRRPLTDAQLKYAVQDVVHLEALAEKLRSALQQRGRTQWLAQCTARTIERAGQVSVTARTTDPWRIRGAGKLNRRQLAVVRELWQWRDQQARRIDRPAFWILDNAKMLELAQWAVAHPNTPLAKGPPLPRSYHGPRFRSLERVLNRARTLPKRELPGKPRGGERSPKAPPETTALLVEHAARLAAELGMDPGILAPRAILEAIALAKPTSAADILAATDALPWQAELLEPIVHKLLGPGS